MRGIASSGRFFKPCGGEKFRRKACVFVAEGRRVFLSKMGRRAFLSQREGRVFLSKIIESLYDGERESARGKALS